MATIIPNNFDLFQRLVNKFFYQKRELNHYKHFYRGVNHLKAENKRILIYAGLGYMYITPVEVLLYHLLRKEGFAVDYLIYDSSIPTCEIITEQVIQEGKKNEILNNLASNSTSILNAAGVDYKIVKKDQRVQQLLDSLPGNLDSILHFSFEGISFGGIIKGVMYRYYKSLVLGDGAYQVAKCFLELALINYFQVKNLLATHRYDYLLFSHGIYASWEPISQLCQKTNNKFICYDRAKTKNTVNFNINQVAPDWSFNSAWDRYEERELSEAEKQKVRQYVQERELQTQDVYAYNFSSKQKDLKVLKKSLGIKQGSKVITIFTNLIWDAANVSRDLAFSSAKECILKTITHFKNRRDVHILLRTHPAEIVLGTKERYGSLISEALKGVLPDNLTIIEPEMKINSFSVIDMSDIGVVNTSTVGLEYAMAGKPIILISETHYRNKGFTYDVNSAVEYFKVIENLLRDTRLLPNQVRLADKYFYMMMFLYQQEMPVQYWNGRFNGYSYRHFNNIPDDNPIVRITKQISKGNCADFVFWG